MEFEDILVQVGDYGKYQRNLLYLFVVLVSLLEPWFTMNNLFFVSVPDHWCNVPELGDWNLTLEEEQLLIRPPGDPKCSMYVLNYTELFSSPTWNWTIQENASTVRCSNGWRYDKSDYDNTASTQWDMVCENSHYNSLVLTMAAVGSIFGTPLYGALSDKFGRRPTFFMIVIITCTTGVASVLMTNFIAFVTLRTINGTAMPSIYQVPFIIVLEIIAPTMRTRANAISCICWTIGLCFLPGLSWLCRDFVIFGLVTSAIPMIFFAYWKFLPESPRWLVSQERYDEALDIMVDVAKKNGQTYDREELLTQLKKLGEQIMKEKEMKGSEEASIMDILRYPRLRNHFWVITLCWVACGAAYYGLQINAPNLGGNEFINFFLLAVVEIPGYLFSWFFMEKFGRRWCSVFTIMLAGVILLVPVFKSNAGVVPSLIGKFGSSAGFMAVYQQGSELYPTVIRALGMGLTGTVHEIFNIAVPYIIYLNEYGKYIPFLIISLICLSAGMAASLLPETLNENLPQTILDADNFGKNQKFLSWSGRRRPSCYEKRASLPEDTGENSNNVELKNKTKL